MVGKLVYIIMKKVNSLREQYMQVVKSTTRSIIKKFYAKHIYDRYELKEQMRFRRYMFGSITDVYQINGDMSTFDFNSNEFFNHNEPVFTCKEADIKIKDEKHRLIPFFRAGTIEIKFNKSFDIVIKGNCYNDGKIKYLILYYNRYE